VIVTRQSKANAAADRWREAMKSPYWGSAYADHVRRNAEKLAALEALGYPANPDDVERLWPGYLAETCDGCREVSETVVLLRSHSEDEYGPCRYCRRCITMAMAEIAPLDLVPR